MQKCFQVVVHLPSIFWKQNWSVQIAERPLHILLEKNKMRLHVVRDKRNDSLFKINVK